ncbi:MAG: substrate-binding domain-containing protein [Opitutales bacterium]
MNPKILPVAAFLLLCGALTAARDIRLIGSDLFGEALRPVLEEEASRRGWDLQLEFEGTLEATRALEAGAADLALLALPRDNPGAYGSRAWPIGFEVTAVVVNEANPLREVALDDLRALFAAPETSDPTVWGAAGAEGAWATRQVSPHSQRDRRHLNLELFRSIVLGPREMRLDLRYWDDKAALLEQIGEETNAIGLVPVGEDHPQVRPLFIAVNAQSQAYNPTAQSVFYGDYPLRLAFYLIVRDGVRDEQVTALARFLIGDEVAAAIEAAGYMPVPATERQQFAMDLDPGS